MELSLSSFTNENYRTCVGPNIARTVMLYFHGEWVVNQDKYFTDSKCIMDYVQNRGRK